MEQWADPLDQPDEFRRQPRPQRSKPRRLSLLCDRRQMCAHLDAGVIRNRLSLGARTSFVQKISLSSGFRSSCAQFPAKEFNFDPTMFGTASRKRSGHQHVLAGSGLAVTPTAYATIEHCCRVLGAGSVMRRTFEIAVIARSNISMPWAVSNSCSRF